jgi:ADP-ribose pyrophosphatase
MHMRDPYAHLSWTERSRTRLASCAIFDLDSSRRTSADGKTGDFWLLHSRDWVNVVPVTRGGDGAEAFVMVRQYRHGAGLITLEFPAGLVEPGEDPEAAAARELLEETGRRAGRLIRLGCVLPNPAFMDNRCYTYLAEDLSEPGIQSPDELERLDAVVIPSRDALAGMGTGELVNSLTLVAVFEYQRWRKRLE